MSVRITDLPEATELNGSELMPIVQNGVTRRTTLDFVNQAAPAALILQQTQQVLADTQQVKAETDQVLVNTEGVYNQTVMVRGQVDISIADWETQYLGAKSDPPTTDNEGNPLQEGALYWNTSLNAMFVWDGAFWTAFSSAVASVNSQIGRVVLDYADVGAANSGANDNITSMSGVTGDIGSAAGLQFNTLTPSATAVGKLTWNVKDSTLDLGMVGGVIQQIGQGMFYSVQNQTGFPINGGSVVRAVGTLNTSGHILVAPATADGVYPSHTFMGVAAKTIQDGDPGLVTFFGKVRDIDTTGVIYGETWVDGDILYAHPGVAGGLTKVKPQAPNNIVMVALVIKAAASGTLFVRTTYGSNLRDDELVRLNGLADGDVLQYNANLGRFENRTLSGAGIEPLGAAADSMVAHLAALDPHPQYITPAEAAAAAPVQSVAGKTGAVLLAVGDVSGAAAAARTITAGDGLTGGGDLSADRTFTLGTPSTLTTTTTNSISATSHTHAVTFPVTSVAGKTGAVTLAVADVSNAVATSDARLSDAREWAASTVTQAEAEAGTETTRRAWTAQRVFQAIAAWWNASAFKAKLDGIEAGAQVNTVTSVAGRTGAVVVSKTDVGLGNVSNDAQLKIASNLSDLNNAVTARTNLGLGNAAVANILGAVSQSGGIPTGAIIEHGSNANGGYVRFADGTQICLTVGNLSATAQVIWTFPASFVSLTYLSAATDFSASPGFYFVESSSASLFEATLYRFVRSDMSPTTDPFGIRAVAIGRWY